MGAPGGAEHQQDRVAAPEISQPDIPAVKVSQGELRRRRAACGMARGSDYAGVTNQSGQTCDKDNGRENSPAFSHISPTYFMIIISNIARL
jgi:hypothetical protein